MIKIIDLNFEKFNKLKYLKVDINALADSPKEIHRRIIAGSR